MILRRHYATAGGGEWLRHVLAKSAFTERVYGGAPPDYYIPGINSTFQLYQVLLRRSAGRSLRKLLVPKFYMLHDAYLMFYRDFRVVRASLKGVSGRGECTAWWRLVGEFTRSDRYTGLNRVTAGSLELAALAAAKWLHRIIMGALSTGGAGEVVKALSGGGVEAALERLVSSGGGGLRGLLEEAVEEATRAVREYAEAKATVGDSLTALTGSGGHGFTHEALSVLAFLERPDGFRKRVRILRAAADVMRRLLAEAPASLTHQQATSQFGGVSGVTRMTRELQLKDVLPEELATLGVGGGLAELLFALKLLQKQVMVLERAATVKPVVFLDKSGSMAEEFGGNIPKISAAAGLALALYRRYGGDIYLFDTEVERVEPRSVVETLLTIGADGGTDISKVLREIAGIGRRDRVYLVVTDAIDEVDSEAIEEVRRRGLAGNVRFILVPPAWEREWLRNFKYCYAHDIASFTDAVWRMLRN